MLLLPRQAATPVQLRRYCWLQTNITDVMVTSVQPAKAGEACAAIVLTGNTAGMQYWLKSDKDISRPMRVVPRYALVSMLQGAKLHGKHLICLPESPL